MIPLPRWTTPNRWNEWGLQRILTEQPPVSLGPNRSWRWKSAMECFSRCQPVTIERSPREKKQMNANSYIVCTFQHLPHSVRSFTYWVSSGELATFLCTGRSLQELFWKELRWRSWTKKKIGNDKRVGLPPLIRTAHGSADPKNRALCWNHQPREFGKNYWRNGSIFSFQSNFSSAMILSKTASASGRSISW